MKKLGSLMLIIIGLIAVLNCACAQTTQKGVYDFEWYQTPAPREEGKAYLEFWAETSPVKLSYNAGNEFDPYMWDIRYSICEANGVDFRIERITEVFFNSDGEVTDAFVNEGEVLHSFWEGATIHAGEYTGNNMYRPVCGDCGYGVSIMGTDANGNELVFGFYLPLSHEIEKTYSKEELMAEHQKQEGQAFLLLTPMSNPAPLLIADDNFGGENGWFFGFTVENQSDIAFTPSELIQQYFAGDGEIYKQVYTAEQMMEWFAPEVYEKDSTWQLVGGFPEQDIEGVGYVLRGVDANGNELEFMTYIELERK